MSAFGKIIGYDKIKTELMQISDMIHRPDAYAALGARMPKGLLLDGEPGLGKTLMAMALMEDSGLPCFTVRRCRSEEGFLKTLEETFGKAADAAPSMILWMIWTSSPATSSVPPNSPRYRAAWIRCGTSRFS